MAESDCWVEWAIELQSLAQAGLTYGKDAFDQERYARIREIAAEMMTHMTDIPLQKLKTLFCNESGYQTPKIDTRAAIFEGEKILLVQENDGKWSLPGGWCDVNVSVGENVVKEVLEEAGLTVRAQRVIAVQDRNKHNPPMYAYGICKVFVQCEKLSGAFVENIETTTSAWFAANELPPLSEAKNTESQIRMCFEAYRSSHWETLLD